MQGENREKPYIIAEIGQNHQGSLEIAKQMVDEIKGLGVDAIKTAKRDIYSFPKEWKTKPYLNENSFGNTYYDHRCALELSKSDFKEFARYVKVQGFDFISSFTDIPSFEFLKKEVQPRYYKIASSRVTDLDLLWVVHRGNHDIILSTGMSNTREVITAYDILKPKMVLQCTSSYPTCYENVNLGVMDHLRALFPKAQIGISGHYFGVFPDLIAYAMGAEVIERHYTFDKEAKGTDHKCSLTAQDFEYMNESLLNIRILKGKDTKSVLDCELPAIKKLR